MFLQAGRYANNPLIKEAVANHDSDKMAEGLKDAGWATDSSYVETLKSIMDTYGLRRFDGLSLEDFKAGEGAGNVIVAAAYSQLGWIHPGKGIGLQRPDTVLLPPGGHTHQPLHGRPEERIEADTHIPGAAWGHPLQVRPRRHIHRRQQVHPRASLG